VVFPRATSFTGELIQQAMRLVEELFRPGERYQKAGVILGQLVPEDAIQVNMFGTQSRQNRKQLMEAMDNINFSMRGDVLKYAAGGLERNWKMRQEMRSKRFTTSWDELFAVG
jgi:DNA polymerase V